MVWKTLSGVGVMVKGAEETLPFMLPLAWTGILLLEICSGSTWGDLNSWVCQQFSTICRPAGQHVELTEFLISRLLLVWRVFLGGMELLAVSDISDVKDAKSWSIVAKHVVKL